MSDYAWGERLPTLDGTRVTLRALEADDAEALLAIFGDPEVMRYWSSPPFPDLAAARKLIADIDAHFVARRLFQWGVVESEVGAVVGTTTLASYDPVHRRAELGVALGRARWGRGLATAALETVIDFAFHELALHRLEADVDPGNARSLRLLERLGFRREGYFRERWHLPDRVCDSVVLGLLAREWRRPE